MSQTATVEPIRPTIRAQAADLTLVSGAPYCSHHEFRSCLPAALILEGDQFFMPVKSNLRAGDKVALVQFQDRSWKRVTGVAEVRVIETTAMAVKIALVGPVTEIPLGDNAAKPARQAEHYVQSNAVARWNVGAKLFEVIDRGQVVYATPNKMDAEAVARGDAPIPPVPPQPAA